MNDMSQVITPKSDQINADDLLAGPMTIRINAVKVAPGTEQPVSIYFDGSDKAYRPCKSMARCMVAAWGPNSAEYVGRSLTLYCDPKVKWGGLEVGGIRISHMTDIAAPITMALTVTRANKKPFTVRPLVATKAAKQADAPALITDEQIATIEARCTEHGISIDRVKAAAKVDALAEIQASRYDGAMGWITKQIDAQQAA